jgi:hypothetical protein
MVMQKKGKNDSSGYIQSPNMVENSFIGPTADVTV